MQAAIRPIYPKPMPYPKARKQYWLSRQSSLYYAYMHDDELWQVYHDNGTPIAGKGAGRADFKIDETLIMGNAHIWFWKQDATGIAIMLQKRALTKTGRPGWYHISAGGHIN